MVAAYHSHHWSFPEDPYEPCSDITFCQLGQSASCAAGAGLLPRCWSPLLPAGRLPLPARSSLRLLGFTGAANVEAALAAAGLDPDRHAIYRVADAANTCVTVAGGPGALRDLCGPAAVPPEAL